jgi:hypothetical protein
MYGSYARATGKIRLVWECGLGFCIRFPTSLKALTLQRSVSQKDAQAILQINWKTLTAVVLQLAASDYTLKRNSPLAICVSLCLKNRRFSEGVG